MKDGKEYSRKLRQLYRLLKQKHSKTEKLAYDESVEALICAIVSEKTSESTARSAMKRLSDRFVDFNDLRVARLEELVEVLGGNDPVNKEVATALNNALRTVFGRYNMVSLNALKKMGKKPARQVLEKIRLNPFVVDYCMLTSLQGHAIPLTQGMLNYLRSNELVHPEADEQEIKGFLTRQISAASAYEFYALLRRESETRRRRAEGQARSKGRIDG